MRRRSGKGTTYASSPGILVNDGGEDGTNGAPHSYPHRSCSVVDEGQHEAYMLFPSTRLSPSPGGILALHSGVEPPPCVGGGLFFISCHFPPSFGRYILPAASSTGTSVNYAYSSIIEGGWCATHTLPPFWLIIPLLGVFFFLQQFVERGPV